MKNTPKLDDAYVPGQMYPTLYAPKGKRSVTFKPEPNGSYTVSEWKGKNMVGVAGLAGSVAQMKWSVLKQAGWIEQ